MTTLDHQLIAAAGIRESAANVARILLAVIAAILWGLGYGTAVTIRGFQRAGIWLAAAVVEGWQDVFPAEADR